jgi:hypothetical protein
MFNILGMKSILKCHFLKNVNLISALTYELHQCVFRILNNKPNLITVDFKSPFMSQYTLTYRCHCAAGRRGAT